MLVTVPQTDFYGFDHVAFDDQFIPFEQCRDLCLRMCQCSAFSYRFDGNGFCYPKGLLFNGYTSPNLPGSIYLKVPRDFNVSAPWVVAKSAAGLACSPNDTVMTVSPDVCGKSPRNCGKWSYLFAFASVLGALDVLFIATGWWFLCSKQSIPSALEAG
ncbi:hypothetical protein ABZP36_017239 [Zizania latifolia]